MTELPVGWRAIQLAALCQPITKVDPLALGRKSIRYIDIGRVDGVAHRLSNVPQIAADGAPTRARQVVAAGDTVFSTVRPYLEKIAFVDESLDGEFASTGFCVLRPGDDLDARYLFHFATSSGLLGQVLPLQRGVSYPAVRDRDVLAAFIPLPPIDEQRRIVDLLEDQLSRLDAAEAALGQSIERCAVLNVSSVMRALTVDDPSGPGTQARFGDRTVKVPSEWLVSTVGAEAEAVEYGTSTKASEVRGHDSVPVLRMGNIASGRLALDRLKYLPRDQPGLDRLRLAPGDLLFNRTNSAELVGKSAVCGDEAAGMTFASYLIRVKFGLSVNPYWASLIINSPLGRAYISSVASQQVGQANVNGTKLKAFPLPLPPRDLQDSILAQHRVLEGAALRCVREVDTTRLQSLALRRGLLQAAFSGRLTGRSSDVEFVEELAGV